MSESDNSKGAAVNQPRLTSSDSLEVTCPSCGHVETTTKLAVVTRARQIGRVWKPRCRECGNLYFTDMSEPNIHDFTEVLPAPEVLEWKRTTTYTHQVWIGQQLICAAPNSMSADMVAQAIECWRHTDEGKAWWANRQREDAKIK